MRVIFLIPCYLNIPVKAFKSFAELMSYTNYEGDLEIIVSIRESCFVHENRNKLLKRALKVHAETPLDYVVWIDSDIQFRLNDVVLLLNSAKEHNADIMSGVYFSKINGVVQPIVSVWDKDRYFWINPSEYRNKPEVFLADSAGMGFVVMKPNVLKTMAGNYNHPFDFIDQVNGELMGEDLVFFKRARGLGFTVLVNKSITVGHCKGVTDVSQF